MSRRMLRNVPSALLMTTALAWNLPASAATSVAAASIPRPAATQKHRTPTASPWPVDRARPVPVKRGATDGDAR